MARKKELSGKEQVPARAERKAQQHRAGTASPVGEAKAQASCSDLQRAPGVSAKDAYLQPGDQHFISFRNQLSSLGLTLRDIQGDGNCLFRALGDQMDGHGVHHMKHRMDTVRFMIGHRHDFEAFIDMPFDRYMDNLSRPGTYAGQDALVAFARLHKVKIIIHQLNSPLWQIEGGGGEDAHELHLSYHNGEHYSSVRRIGDSADTPAQVRLSFLTQTVPCCAAHAALTSSGPVTSTSQTAIGRTKVVPSKETKSSVCWASPSTDNASCAALFADSATEDDIDSGAEGFKPSVKLLDREPNDLIQETMIRASCADEDLVANVLAEHGYDVDLAVDYLLSISIFINDGATEEEQLVEGQESEKTDDVVLDRQQRNTVTSANRTKEPKRPPMSNRERKDFLRREKQARKREQSQKRIEANEGTETQELTSTLGFLNL